MLDLELRKTLDTALTVPEDNQNKDFLSHQRN